MFYKVEKAYKVTSYNIISYTKSKYILINCYTEVKVHVYYKKPNKMG